METSSAHFLVEQLLVAFRFLYEFSYVWVTLLFVSIFFNTWLLYRKALFVKKQGWKLLEIKLPKEIRKSPQAMELVFTTMWQKASMSFKDTYIDGKIVPYYSLELVSIGGEVHFYIWTQNKMKDIVEAQIYAHYPTVEIYEVPDYTIPVVLDPTKMLMWGTHFKLNKPDPFPIKTYIDYELDKHATEKDQETVIDPMASMIEYLGSISRDEQVWIQILIRANRDYGLDAGHIIKKKNWIGGVDEEIAKVLKKYEIDPKKDPGKPPPPFTEEDKNLLKALNRSKSKYAFDTMMRAIYICQPGKFNGSRITGLLSSLRQYDDNVLNGFGVGLFTDFDYPWQDFMRMRRTQREKMMLDAYKRRGCFYGEYQYWAEKPFVLTTEELATIYHFPGGMVSTPTMGRIGSRKAEAPNNLPV